MKYNVIIGSTYWTLTGVNIFCANLARELNAAGTPAHILLTEQKTRLVTIYDPFMDIPDDLPVRFLPVQPTDSWGAHWGALIRYLEELAPCIYIPNADWRHSCVSSMLSDKVGLVGVVHSDDPMHYEHVQRLGDYWNAIVTVSKTVAEKVAEANPKWMGKISTIPIGVSVPAGYPIRNEGEKAPLRIIYHGLINQWQKRILDLPKILQELRARNVPVQLTIAGGGKDEARLRQDLRKLDLLKFVDFLGVVPHSKMLKILESQDVFILTSEFEGMPNALLESMGKGCVPVVTRVQSGIPELVKDGENGYLIPIGDISAFADRLAALARDRKLWSRLSLEAYQTLKNNSYNSKVMAQSYKELFDRVQREIQDGKYHRIRGVLVPPPAESGGFKIFPLEKLEKIEGVGSFPSLLDYEDFEREIVEVKKPKWRKRLGSWRNSVQRTFFKERPVGDFRVIFSLPRKEFSLIRFFSETLVRQLKKHGISAEILLTEQNTELVERFGFDMDFASDIPVRRLPLGKSDGWGAHWGAMVRYLESNSPCIYIPNHDWRHSCVTPLLSKDVAVIAVTHGDDAVNYDHISRLGKFFNAIVAVTPAIEENIVNANHLVAPYTMLIPYGIPVAERLLPRNGYEGSPIKIFVAVSFKESIHRDHDLLKIMRELGKAGIPVEWTIAQCGYDPEKLIKALEPPPNVRLRVSKSIQYTETMADLDSHDVFLWTEQISAAIPSIRDAMARGCVPLLFQHSQDWVKDGWNGFVVEKDNFNDLIMRIVELQKDRELIQKFSLCAYQTFSQNAFRDEDMLARYIQLFQSVLQDAQRGLFRRPKGSILPPPAQIHGVGILPTEYTCYAKWIGSFPSKKDYYDFKRQMQLLTDSKLPLWLAGIKRRSRKTAKDRLHGFRSWKKTFSARSQKRIHLLRKKMRRHASKFFVRHDKA